MKHIALALIFLLMFFGYAVLEQGVNLLDIRHMAVGMAMMVAGGFMVYRVVRDA